MKCGRCNSVQPAANEMCNNCGGPLLDAADRIREASNLVDSVATADGPVHPDIADALLAHSQKVRNAAARVQRHGVKRDIAKRSNGRGAFRGERTIEEWRGDHPTALFGTTARRSTN